MKKMLPDKPNMVGTELTCVFGEPWMGRHPLCAAETARVCGVPVADVPVPDYSLPSWRKA